MRRRQLSTALLAAAMAMGTPGARAESAPVLVEATYERAWLTEIGWSITIRTDGRVEERLVRNRCRRRGCGEDRISRRRKGRLSRQQLERLREAAEDGAFFDLQPQYPSGIEDAVAAKISVPVGGRTHEVRVEDPWWEGIRVDPAFARIWNLVIAYGRPSARRDPGWEIP